MGAENLSPTEIRSPDRPARSESLHRLSYRGPHDCFFGICACVMQQDVWHHGVQKALKFQYMNSSSLSVALFSLTNLDLLTDRQDSDYVTVIIALIHEQH
jgi:hypothetical protein